MATFYLDYEVGSDANDGSAWGAGTAWKTITAGATAARIAPGDIIRIAKSPAPASLGITAKWTNGPVASTQVPASSTNATPIVVTKTAHGYLDGDIVQVVGHATNTAANGVWVVANKTDNTFELQGSVGNGVGGATGTMRQINAKAVVLASALTATVDNCEVAWTVDNSSSVARTGIATDCKSGDACMQITAPASPAANTLYAHATIASTDFSGKQKITFWIRNEVAIADGTTWVLKLCSDTAGVTAVDTFVIPAIPSTGRWLPLTIARTGGGNLGAAIQSIALYSGASVPTASKYIRLDNIQACTTSGINLQSLISKNSAEQGGSEGWYGIQSINGTIVLLDQQTNTLPNVTAFTGYYGTSETVTTYIRETIKTALQSSFAGQTIQDSGTLAGGNIQFQGGYNTSNSAQDGETFFDGLNGQGIGLSSGSKNYLTVNYINTYRYDYGYYFDTTSFCTITTFRSCNNFEYGINCSSFYSNSISNCLDLSNNSVDGMLLSGNSSGNMITIDAANGNASRGIMITGSAQGNIISLTSAKGNATYGARFDAGAVNNRLSNVSTIGNTTGGTYNDSSANFLRNAAVAESTEVGGLTANRNYRLYSYSHDATKDNDWIFTDGGTINKQAATTQPGTGFAWKLIPGSTRVSNYPLKLQIAQIAVNANAAVTVKAYVKLDHATNIAAKLVIPGGQLAGMSASDVVVAKAADTNWEELTLADFTPTEAGVVVIECWAWYVAGTSNAYIDTLTVTQA